MAEENPRIEINDFTKPIVNSRIQYLEENDNKIKGRKGLLFGSFINEKERVKKAIEDNSWMMGNSLIKTKIETKKRAIRRWLPGRRDKVPTPTHTQRIVTKDNAKVKKIRYSINK